MRQSVSLVESCVSFVSIRFIEIMIIIQVLDPNSNFRKSPKFRYS
jgi:hypothetical protein